MNKVEDENHFIVECPTYNEIRQESPINFETYTNTEAIFHLEDPANIAQFLRKAYTLRDKLSEAPPETYRIIKKTSNGMKLLLCKRKTTTGHMTVRNVTKDGLKLKICRTSQPIPSDLN